MHIDILRRKPIGQSHHTVGFYKEQGKPRKEKAILKQNYLLETLLFLPSPASRIDWTTAAGQNTYSF